MPDCALQARRPGRWLRALAILALTACGCATLPNDPVQRALYLDLRKAVDLSESTGWVVDRIELEDRAENALLSACQVAPEARDDLDAWIGGQVLLAGGPAQQQYADSGGDLDAAEDALTLERTQALLRYATQHAPHECPFWLPTDPQFAGVEGDAGRFALLLETRGFGGFTRSDDATRLAGGGGARVLLGRGLGSRLTLAAGVEVGGFGGLADNQQGSRRIDATITGALPVMLRIADFARVYDFELAPVFRFDPDSNLHPPGVRANLGAGLSTLRTTDFMPYIVLWLGYELYPARNGLAVEHVAMLGTRVGVDWDP